MELTELDRLVAWLEEGNSNCDFSKSVSDAMECYAKLYHENELLKIRESETKKISEDLIAKMMKDNGLSEEDMFSDITYPHEI